MNKEHIARALYVADNWRSSSAGTEWDENLTDYQKQPYMVMADAVLPLIAQAQADAWLEIARLAPRFWNKVRIGSPAECWEFDGPQLAFGHGRYNSPAGMVAHRYAWALANGRLPTSDEVVRHACDNPPCCNPAHLNIGTQQDNVDDMLARERAPFKTGFCRKGHELTPDNVIFKNRGRDRRCKKCVRAYETKRRSEQPRTTCPDCSKSIVSYNLARHRLNLHGVPSAKTTELLRARAAAITGDQG